MLRCNNATRYSPSYYFVIHHHITSHLIRVRTYVHEDHRPCLPAFRHITTCKKEQHCTQYCMFHTVRYVGCLSYYNICF